MLTYQRIAIVGSREFKNYGQLQREVLKFLGPDDWVVSGGALGADSMAQRLQKERGGTICIIYPRWRTHGIYDAGAGFKRNYIIVENSDIILAFYAAGRFQQGGTRHTIEAAIKLGKEYYEFSEEMANA